MSSPKIKVTRDGGLYIKPSDLVKDPKVQNKMLRFAKIMRKHKKESEQKETSE